jgi:hypothetical protein
MNGDDDMVQITNKDGLTVWVTRPPAACPHGHPFRVGDVTTYQEAWFACGCDGARRRDGRPGHTQYTCKRCRAATNVPECTDPTLKIGWAASHGH